MADSREFTLIGSFQDGITGPLTKINNSVSKLKDSLSELSKVTQPLKSDFKSLGALSKNFSTSLKGQSTDIKNMTAALRGLAAQAKRTNSAMKLGAGRRARGGGGGIPGMPPGGGGGGGVRPPRGGGGGRPPRGGGDIGDFVAGGLITSAIVSGFQIGTGIMQKGMSIAVGAFAERARDQIDDIGAAGGIFSASMYSKVDTGLPKTFQGAMDVQDSINKSMAVIAGNLPGTTHDFVSNSRRLVDTTALVMSQDLKAFMGYARELTGNMKISGEEAFSAVNVEIAKATTLLEKMNPTKTVVPMTQIVEDMLKTDEVSIKGLRRFAAFKKSTTFEAALTRNLKMLNETGSKTPERLKAVTKVLNEAVPAEMINAYRLSVTGFMDGLKSAFLDPDVGMFGLSSTLGIQVKKFNKDTGQAMVDEFGKQVMEFTNFFRVFSDIVGAFGNLINTGILPGLVSMFPPFEALTKGFETMRELGFKVFERQQMYTNYFEDQAAKFGMSKENFKVFEKGGVSVVMDLLKDFGMISSKDYKFNVQEMEKGGTEKDIQDRMDKIYAQVIPAIFNSPFFKGIGAKLGESLATVFKEIAEIMKVLLGGKLLGASQFTSAFADAGGINAINDIVVMALEGLFKLIQEGLKLYISSLGSSIKEGKFGATSILGGLALLMTSPVLSQIPNIIGAFTKLNTAIASGGLFTRLLGFADKVKGSLGNFMKFLSMGPGLAKFGAFFKTFAGKFAIFAGVLTTIMSLFKGEDLATSLAMGAGPALGSALGTILGGALGSLVGPVGTVAGAVIGGGLGAHLGSRPSVVLGLGEIFSSLGGSLKGLFDVVMQVVYITGDFINLIVQSIGKITGLTGPIDALKFLLVPITATLQVLELAFKGFAVALAMLRTHISNIAGSKDYQKNLKEEQNLRNEYYAATGRQAAYNDSMNKDNLKKQLNNKQFEFNNNKNLKEQGPALKAYIDEAKKQLTTGKPAAKPPGVPNFTPVAPKLNEKFVQPSTNAAAAIVTPQAPAAVAAQAQAAVATSTNTQQLNQKATTQITKATQTHAVAVSLRANSTTANATLGNIQAGVNRISSLLASGSLKVSGVLAPGQTTGKPVVTTPIKPKPSYDGHLGDAISSEMRNKPTGSKLLIANSSETVIPAAGGYGVKKLMDILVDGFSSIKNQYTSLATGVNNLDKKTTKEFQTVNKTIDTNQNQNQQEFTKINQNFQQLSTKVSSMSMGGMGGMGGLGAGYGSAGGQIAGQLGNFIKQTGGAPGSIHEHPQHGGVKGRHASGSYHYQGRAIDIGGNANEQAGILSRIAQFNAQYGVKPVELFHAGNDPAGHSDHVHVAYAYGAGKPAFFNSQREAEQWEKSMVPGSMKVGSITGNSGEGFGSSSINVVNNISISQQSGQSADELASIVAMKIGDAVAEARAASIFV